PGRVALAHARRANLRLTDALPRRDGRTHARAAWPRPPRPHHPRRGELMPPLADHPSSSVIKLLNIGESKTGKTGALASLVKAGYTLHILDYDNGLDILQTALRGDNAALARVHFATLRDTIVMHNGTPRLKAPVHAYKDAGKTLQEWGVEAFTPNDVIVLDTLTTFSDAAFNEACSIGGRL